MRVPFVKPALFDVLTGQEERSFESEVNRILSSRHLSDELDGLVSDFGIPVPTMDILLPAHKQKMEYTIAQYLMRFEPRLQKVTVRIESIREGKIIVSLDLYPQLMEAPHFMRVFISR